jgi:hypothetical protein
LEEFFGLRSLLEDLSEKEEEEADGSSVNCVEKFSNSSCWELSSKESGGSSGGTNDDDDDVTVLSLGEGEEDEAISTPTQLDQQR